MSFECAPNRQTEWNTENAELKKKLELITESFNHLTLVYARDSAIPKSKYHMRLSKRIERSSSKTSRNSIRTIRVFAKRLVS